MKENEFKVGQVVQLRAGKRKMVVVSPSWKGLYTCKWEVNEGFTQDDFMWYEIKKVRK